MTVVERPSSGGAQPRRVRHRGPRNRLRIAVIGIVFIVVIIYGAFTKRIPFMDGYRVEAVFQNANQLTQGFSPVRIAGVTVGKVVKISNGPGATAVVTMQLDNQALPVHADARARIRPRLFLEGGFYVDLQPGSPSGAVLEDGDQIPVRQTAVPVQLSQILSGFDRSTRDDFRQVLEQLDRGLSDGGATSLAKAWKPLGPLLRDTSVVFESLRGNRPRDASDTIRNSARITSVLAEREQELRGLITSLARTTTTLASHDTELSASIREFDRLLREAPESLDQIEAAVPVVRRFANALRPSLRAAPPVLDHTDAVLAQLGGLVSQRELGGAVDALRPTASRLPAIEQQLNVLFPLVTPVTDCIRDRVVPTVDKTVPDGALSSGRPVYQDLAHAFVGLASAGQSFDANGFNVRYSAGSGSTAVRTGSVPGFGVLGGLSTEPVAGARPSWLGPGVLPAFRPDVPCTANAVPDLTQRASGTTPMASAPVTVARTSVDSRSRLQATIERATRELQGTP